MNEHDRRVARVTAAGWKPLDETTWERDTSDSRWATTAQERITAGTPEEALRATFIRQLEIEALERRSALRPLN